MGASHPGPGVATRRRLRNFNFKLKRSDEIIIAPGAGPTGPGSGGAGGSHSQGSESGVAGDPATPAARSSEPKSGTQKPGRLRKPAADTYDPGFKKGCIIFYIEALVLKRGVGVGCSQGPVNST